MRALVTGGGGFLGGAIARRLVDSGARVRSFARGAYPELEAAGVEVVRGDLADDDAVAAAAAGCDVVYHVAALAGVWGRLDSYHSANVVGTENVLQACRKHGVARLVYTSSPSVIYGRHSLEGVDESVPYPTHFEAHYPRTKAIAEQAVLAANRPELLTVALRPHLIWGPGDQHLVPRILARARSGQLRIVGDGTNLVDSIYIDNAVDAHLAAAERLVDAAQAPAGRAYFLSNGEPLPMAELLNRILAAAGEPPVERKVPYRLAVAAGSALEATYRVLRRETEPRMTRFLARQLGTAHWFDIGAARRDLEYAPRVSIDDGMARLATWLSSESGRP